MSEHDAARRHWLKLLAVSACAASAPGLHARVAENSSELQPAARNADHDAPRVGIALGAGGASGLAHILMLEALDEMDITPHQIAGSSIGAVIGALYASGLSGNKLRELVERFIISPDEGLIEELLHNDALRWVEFLEIDLGHGALLSSEGFISFLYDTLECEEFEQTRIPLKIVAGDLWSREQVVLDSGPLLSAVKASMALPGVFKAVESGDRTLIDGGTVNPVPYDLLTGHCDIVIAIDVIGERTRPKRAEPSYFETVFNAAKVMQQAIMTEKLRREKPALYLAPRIVDIRALEFYRATEIFEQALPTKQELKRELTKLLEGQRVS